MAENLRKEVARALVLRVAEELFGRVLLDDLAEVHEDHAVGDAYNARLPVLKEQGSALDKERQIWVERCADKDFDEIDEAAIKRERQRAAKAAGKAASPK